MGGQIEGRKAEYLVCMGGTGDRARQPEGRRAECMSDVYVETKSRGRGQRQMVGGRRAEGGVGGWGGRGAQGGVCACVGGRAAERQRGGRQSAECRACGGGSRGAEGVLGGGQRQTEGRRAECVRGRGGPRRMQMGEGRKAESGRRTEEAGGEGGVKTEEEGRRAEGGRRSVGVGAEAEGQGAECGGRMEAGSINLQGRDSEQFIPFHSPSGKQKLFHL